MSSYLKWCEYTVTPCFICYKYIIERHIHARICVKLRYFLEHSGSYKDVRYELQHSMTDSQLFTSTRLIKLYQPTVEPLSLSQTELFALSPMQQGTLTKKSGVESKNFILQRFIYFVSQNVVLQLHKDQTPH